MPAPFDFFNQLMMGSAALSQLSVMTYKYNARELVFQKDKIKLYHYQPNVKHANRPPLLVVFATVNRPEILDLFPETSFIGGLLENGMDVYLLDWGYPDVEDSDISLSDYVSEYLQACVQYIKTSEACEQIDLLGICQGGIMCLCYAILHADIRKLVLISTPIDFSTSDNVVAKMLNQLHIDELTSVAGNISGAWLTQFFISMRPFELIGKKYLRFIDNVTDKTFTDKFVRVEKWLYDAPDQTSASFAELIKELYQQNKLIKGEFIMANKRIDLSKLAIPVLNVMASEDEIVPVSASRALKKYVSPTHYSQRIFPSGHIGIYISDKVGKRMPKAIASWIKK